MSDAELQETVATMRFEVLMVVKMWKFVLWVLTSCGCVGRYQHFKGTLIYLQVHMAL
jgi:hypothetical protein